MGRVAGHRDGSLVLVGSEPPRESDLEFIDVPQALQQKSDGEILAHYRVLDRRLCLKAGLDRVALVSPFHVPCGISTYAEKLWAHLLPKLKEGHVFAERENVPEVPGVTRCWSKGQPLTELVNALTEYQPTTILIQHEYGYFPNARHWLSFLGALSDFRVITVLHSVYPAHQDKTIVEAACPEIIVHTKGARDTLLNVKNVTGRVSVIPHGCTPYVNRAPLWNFYNSNHTILQFGFGFPYKGWEQALQVVAALKEKFPDVFYTGLMSERWPGTAVSYVNELNRLAAKLGVTENVGLVRGFQSDACLDSYLRTNKVALFPYKDNGEHAVMGCSGAARVAMSSGIPVVAAGVPLFEDLEGVVSRPMTVDGWVEAISALFEDSAAQVERQNRFLEANSWDVTAQRYLTAMG